MDEEPIKINKEKIELITYERSKWWSSFMGKIFDSQPEEEWDECLVEYVGDSLYNGDGEGEEQAYKHIEMADEAKGIVEKNNGADDDDDDDEEGLTILTQDLTVSNAKGILAQINRKAHQTGIIDSEVQKVLEETLPIVEEYKKDWHKAGLERILNTFDKQKIENEIGDWLYRHNSIAHRTFISQPKHQYRFHENWHKDHRKVDYETDSDSLHSVDTASYIRKCKKDLNIKKKVATTTTTIKSYRLIESKRNELRKKYAYLAPDDTMQLIYNKERCRKEVPSYRIIPVRVRDSSRIERIHLSHDRRSIRKQRFRRRCSSPYTSYTSSDDEAVIKRKKFIKTRCGEYCHNYSYRIPNISHNNCHNQSYELLPYIHESECSCRGADKLCKSARHIANSSTEDWLVENCRSPQKIQRKSEELMIRKFVTNNTATSLLNKDQTIQQKVGSKSNKSQHKKKVLAKPTLSKNLANNSSLKSQKQMIASVKKNYEKPNCETVEKNLKEKKVISLKPKENNSNTKTNVKDIELRKHNIELASKTNKKKENKTSKAKKKSSKNKTLKSKQNQSDSLKEEFDKDAFEQDLKIAIKMSKQSYEEEKERKIKNKCHINFTKGNCEIQNHNIVPKDKANVNENKQNESHTYSETTINKAVKSGVAETPHTATKLLSKLSTQLQMDDNLKTKNSKKETTKTALNTIKESELEGNDSSEIKENYSREKCINKKQFPKETTKISRKVSFSENTFFGHSHDIYNSTALGNNTATSRQILANTATLSTKNLSKLIEGPSGIVNCKEKLLRSSAGIGKSLNNINVNGQENHEGSTTEGDCMIISSTTDSDLQQTVIPSTTITNKSNERILLYTPKNQSAVPGDSIIDGRFKVTEDHLASFLGPTIASKFMKYYPGPCHFKQTSEVYYKPPKHEIEENDSSDSELDFLDLCHQYGELVEIKNVDKSTF